MTQCAMETSGEMPTQDIMDFRKTEEMAVSEMDGHGGTYCLRNNLGFTFGS